MDEKVRIDPLDVVCLQSQHVLLEMIAHDRAENSVFQVRSATCQTSACTKRRILFGKLFNPALVIPLPVFTLLVPQDAMIVLLVSLFGVVLICVYVDITQFVLRIDVTQENIGVILLVLVSVVVTTYQLTVMN